jgi:hypothetical protein
MATPEAKVKAKVKAALDKYGVYYFMPATHGYGSSGVPDIIVCMQGRFIGIECKAKGNKPTALQMRNLVAIATSGIAIIVDETGIGAFQSLIDLWAQASIPNGGQLFTIFNNAEATTV